MINNKYADSNRVPYDFPLIIGEINYQLVELDQKAIKCFKYLVLIGKIINI